MAATLLLLRMGTCDLGPIAIIDCYQSQSSSLGKSHGSQWGKDGAKIQVLLETIYKRSCSILRN